MLNQQFLLLPLFVKWKSRANCQVMLSELVMRRYQRVIREVSNLLCSSTKYLYLDLTNWVIAISESGSSLQIMACLAGPLKDKSNIRAVCCLYVYFICIMH